MKSFKKLFYLLISAVILSPVVLPEIVRAQDESKTILYLSNGDSISGNIISENKKQITIENDILGPVTIKKESIDKMLSQKDQKIQKKETEKAKLESEEENPWEREIAIGFDRARGNTENTQFTVRLYANRKTDNDEFTLKGKSFYSSTDRKMDGQSWYGLLRYGKSFWKKKWYHFYKLEGDHDRFANINYRLTPSAGVGYWFSDAKDYKFMTELGVGYEYTNYRDNTDSQGEVILVPRGFLEKRLFGESRLSVDLSLYPSLEDTKDYRLRLETAFTNPINDKLSLRFSVIDNYNSSPTAEAKKNDIQLISSLNYSF